MKELIFITGGKRTGKTKIAHDIFAKDATEFISFKHFLQVKDPSITKILIDGFDIRDVQLFKEYVSCNDIDNLLIVLISNSCTLKDIGLDDCKKRPFNFIKEIKCY